MWPTPWFATPRAEFLTHLQKKSELQIFLKRDNITKEIASKLEKYKNKVY